MTKPGQNGRSKSMGFPELTARKNWRKYLAGMATEVLYALLLAAVALAMAFLAMAVYG